MCEKLKLPEEILLIFVKDRHSVTADLLGEESGTTWTTAFVVTDMSFMFMEPKSPQHPDVARRIPFEDVKSFTLDLPRAQLEIVWDGGKAWVGLPIRQDQMALRGTGDWAAVCISAARGMVYYFQPFLPLRLQQGW